MTITQKKLIISIVMMTIVLILPMVLLAQLTQVPEGGGELDTPIDGGLTLLVAAGVGYGSKKLKERRKFITKNK